MGVAGAGGGGGFCTGRLASHRVLTSHGAPPIAPKIVGTRYFRLVGQTMSYSDGPSLAAKSKGYIDLSGNGILRAAPDPGKYRKAGSFFLYV
jgi:hypothetical protein